MVFTLRLHGGKIFSSLFLQGDFCLENSAIVSEFCVIWCINFWRKKLSVRLLTALSKNIVRGNAVQFILNFPAKSLSFLDENFSFAHCKLTYFLNKF